MNPTPSPIDVYIHPGPAEWWEVLGALGPLAVLLGAVLAARISWGTLRQRTAADALALAQKREADNRAEWWKRTQWALDHVLDEDPDARALGLAALAVLARSELARPEELELLDIAWQAVDGNAVGGNAVGADADDDNADDEAPAAENVDSADDVGDNGTTSSAESGEGRK